MHAGPPGPLGRVNGSSPKKSIVPWALKRTYALTENRYSLKLAT